MASVKLTAIQKNVLGGMTTVWGAVPEDTKTATLNSLVKKGLLEYNPDDGTYRLAPVEEPELDLAPAEVVEVPVVEEVVVPDPPEANEDNFEQQIIELLESKGKVAARTHWKETLDTTWKVAVDAVAKVEAKYPDKFPLKPEKPSRKEVLEAVGVALDDNVAKKTSKKKKKFKITREVLKQLGSDGCNIRVEKPDGSTFYAVVVLYNSKAVAFIHGNERLVMPRLEFNNRLKDGSIEILPDDTVLPVEKPKVREVRIMELSSKVKKVLADKPRMEVAISGEATDPAKTFMGALTQYGSTCIVISDSGAKHSFEERDFNDMVIKKQIRVIDQRTAPVAPEEDEEMPPADDRLERVKTEVAEKMAYAKGRLAERLETIAKGLTDKAKVLKATQDDPTSYSGLNMYGELQDVSQIESLVGEIIALQSVYKLMK